MWQKEFQELLQKNFQEMKGRNPSFSLRSFARKLDMSPGGLSEILRGRRQLSVHRARVILKTLANRDTELEKMLERIADSQESRMLLSDEAHVIVANWESFAILSCLSSDSPPETLQKLALRLGLSLQRTEEITNHLITFGLVTYDGEGRLIESGADWATTDGIPSSSIRQSYLNGFELSKKATELPVDERDFTSLTFTGSKTAVDKVRKEIRNFREKVLKIMSEPDQESVFRLDIQMYPLDGWEK